MKIVKELNQALANKKAIPAFNVAGFDAMLGVAEAGKICNKPIIIQTSKKLVLNYGPPLIKQWFDTVKKHLTNSIFLHLDHCDDLDVIRSCVNEGWDMVMFDGTHLPFLENCQITRDVVSLAHANGVAVEAEVGSIGGMEDGFKSEYAYPSFDDIRLMGATGIDCIAIGFGNVHGEYETKSNLRWDIYEKGYELTGLPLVLHGGSGLDASEFKRSILAGTAKINISTDLKKVYLNLFNAKINDGDWLNPMLFHNEIQIKTREVAVNYINIFE